jgi:AraC-like DNA-binding protein
MPIFTFLRPPSGRIQVWPHRGKTLLDTLWEMLSHSSEPVAGLTPDPLSEVLQNLRLSGVAYARCDLTCPWGIDLPPQSAASFHFVVRGACWLHTVALGWVQLNAGDAVLLPHGTQHAIADSARSRTQPLEGIPLEEIGDRTYQLRAGGGGSSSLLVCCSVSFEEPALHPLLELMPEALVVRAASTSDSTLPLLLDTMAREVDAQRIGAATVMTRLADLVIARIIRSWVEEQCQNTTGWLAAIQDPKIGQALAAIHRRPGDAWSVNALADVSQTSRSVFSERFTSVVGVPPARYLARWRMHLASEWLRRDRLSVAQTALRLGYESEASFSRAFKRSLGVPPSAVRRLDARGADRQPWPARSKLS